MAPLKSNTNGDILSLNQLLIIDGAKIRKDWQEALAKFVLTIKRRIKFLRKEIQKCKTKKKEYHHFEAEIRELNITWAKHLLGKLDE